jgi:hypothetical protein
MTELMPRYVRSITVDVKIPTLDDEWHTLTGWDAPMLYRTNPEKGVLRIFSGDEPGESIACLTEYAINEMIAAGRTDEWLFGMGQWRLARFGELRP